MIEDAVALHRRGATARLLARALRYARPYAGHVLVSIALLMLVSAAINALPLLIRRAIDRRILAAELPVGVRWSGLVQDAAWFLVLAGGAFVLRFLESMLTAWIGQRIVHNVRMDAFRRAQSLDMAMLDRTPIGRLMTRLTSDIEAVQRFITEGLVGGVADLFMLIGVVGFMWALDRRLAAWTLAALPPMVAALAWVNVRLRRAGREIRTRASALNSLLQEQIAGMTTIQLFNREEHARRQHDERNDALFRAHLDEVRWFSLYWPVLETAQAVSMVLVLVLAVAGRSSGAAVSVGALAAFLAYVRELYRPIGALADKAGLLQQAAVSAERLFDLLDTPVTIADPLAAAAPEIPDPPAGGPAIRFDHVWFAYSGEHWVLQDVDLDIRPGESVAVVGTTGAGKSTLAALLARFYDVTRGAVRVGGVDVREVPLRDLRRRIGLVLQEPFLFSGTIAENIALADPARPRADIEAAARFVHAHEFIERLPRGYDTLAGERGGTLSAGEKQLIALARIALAAPPLLVVLDEATSSVDSETEHRIQQAIRRLMRGRTTLAIAHRLSTIRDADRIIVLRQGRVVAQGPHEDLLRSSPYYRRLYELLGLDTATAA